LLVERESHDRLRALPLPTSRTGAQAEGRASGSASPTQAGASVDATD
jgi:hypothetical protein